MSGATPQRGGGAALMSGTGIILCGSWDAAVALGDGYVIRPLPEELRATIGDWVAVPKRPVDRLAVERTLARWGVGPSATARASDPATAHEAAARAATGELTNRMLCLHAHVYAGARGLTGDELENATGRPYEAIGPRRPSLEQAGLLRKATTVDGQLRKRGGKQVYVVTAAGITHYQQHRSAAA